MATSTKDFVIQGYVYQAGNKILNGIMRVKNLNEPTQIVAVKLGQLNDGTTNPPTTDGFYDAWWVSGGNVNAPIVANVGDEFEFTVYPLSAVVNPDLPLELLEDPVTVTEPPIFPAVVAPPVTQANIDSAMMLYDVYAAANVLPEAIVIAPENIEMGYNLKFTNNPIVKWCWFIPADNENQPIHFKVEWSKDSTFPTSVPGAVGVATTEPGDPTRTLFKYEYNPDVFGGFPSGGVENRTGWRCMIEMSLGSASSIDGEYYWRVSATDGTMI